MWFHKADWLDFDSIQSGHNFGSDTYAFVSKARSHERHIERMKLIATLGFPVLVAPVASAPVVKAFPTAEGFGANALGPAPVPHNRER
jgi:hypothetical protein